MPTSELTPAEAGRALAQAVIKTIERKTGPKVDKARVKTMIIVCSMELMSYFAQRRL